MRLARSLILPSIVLLTLPLVACNDDTTPADDDVGSASDSTDSGDSTSESAGDSGSTDASTDTSTTDSTDASTTDTTDASTTDSTDTTETTGGGMCNGEDVLDADLTLALVGSQAPLNGCNDHVFAGTLQAGGGGNWTLDACPCGAQCLIPDPYTLTIMTPTAAALPNVPGCPSIDMRRNAACEVVSITITDLSQADAPVWIGSRENTDPGTVAGVDVTAVEVGVCDCPDCDPPTLYQLDFDSLGDALLLSEGETGAVGDWTAYSFSSHTYEVGGTSHFAWVMKR